MSAPLILILDDEENIRRILVAMLASEGYATIAVKNLTEAKDALKHEAVQVVLSDLRLEREDGLTLLKWLREQQLALPFIVLTAHGSIDSAVDAMKQGAFDYLSKPFERTELSSVIRKAVLTYQYNDRERVRGELGPMMSLIGQNEKMKRIYQLVEKVAPTDANVLVTGESGTGKELIAAALHEHSARKQAPFIKINCAAIPETLMESELFGYEKGAFTGAVNSKPGRFELADNGTLFLDEIAEMSTEMQVKLLRVLQERTFERVGGLRTIKVDVRLITATNQDLDERVKSGKFRSDLFYRLNVVPIHLPPLRERVDDIPRLIALFVEKFTTQLKKKAPQLHPETLELLVQYPWPGNVRQLENVVERLVVIDETGTVLPDQLPEEILDFEEQLFIQKQPGKASLKEMVKDATRRIEKRAIEEALTDTGNNVTHAARKLNISRKSLQLKMKELGLRST